MRSRLAALIALSFAAAVSTPDVGLMVHRHAGGDRFHVHADLEDHPHRHDDEDHDRDHLEDHHHHAESAHHHHDGPELSAADAAWTWHSHATRPFHRAVASQTTRVPPPRPVTRLVPAPPSLRLGAAAISGRSRGPPPVRAS